MLIKSLEVSGLHGRENNMKLLFNTDMNIITGRNGSGKTTILKLIWYILSGNISIALREVNFKKAVLETSIYTCTVYRIDSRTCKITFQTDGDEEIFEDITDDDGDIISNAEDQVNPSLIQYGASVFFPTFRRIEGGFTLGERYHFPPRSKGDIEDSLIMLSKRLSNQKHMFVASLSTTDIVSLIVSRFTELSEEYNSLQQATSQDLILRIKALDSINDNGERLLEAAIEALSEIRQQIESMEASREEIMKPLDAIRILTMSLLKHSGIQLNKTFSFGDAANAISSDALSAGEKQMLSFIAYNALYENAIFIVDEPELSLHIDWQRQLFPILISQQKNNQFIIATHSPFIYSKYPEKELQLDPDRGNIEG